MVDKDEFLQKISSMTPIEMAEFISQNGKGPKVIQLVTWDESKYLENNTGVTMQ